MNVLFVVTAALEREQDAFLLRLRVLVVGGVQAIVVEAEDGLNELQVEHVADIAVLGDQRL